VTGRRARGGERERVMVGGRLKRGKGGGLGRGEGDGLMVGKGLGIKVGKRRKGGNKWERVTVGSKGLGWYDGETGKAYGW
jgi:hypothetical protein